MREENRCMVETPRELERKEHRKTLDYCYLECPGLKTSRTKMRVNEKLNLCAAGFCLFVFATGHARPSAVVEHGSRPGASRVRLQRQDRHSHPKPHEVQAVQRGRRDLRRAGRKDQGADDPAAALGTPCSWSHSDLSRDRWCLFRPMRWKSNILLVFSSFSRFFHCSRF